MGRASSFTSGFHDFCWVALHFTGFAAPVRLACLGWLDVATRDPGKWGEISGSQDAGAGGKSKKIGGRIFLARFEKKENGPFFFLGGGKEWTFF